MANKDSDLYIAVVNAIVHLGRARISIRRGETVVRKGHALLKEHGNMFAPIHVHYDVEQATAVPGERRALTLPKSDKS